MNNPLEGLILAPTDLIITVHPEPLEQWYDLTGRYGTKQWIQAGQAVFMGHLDEHHIYVMQYGALMPIPIYCTDYTGSLQNE